jgi:hypothetical protein
MHPNCDSDRRGPPTAFTTMANTLKLMGAAFGKFAKIGNAKP